MHVVVKHKTNPQRKFAKKTYGSLNFHFHACLHSILPVLKAEGTQTPIAFGEACAEHPSSQDSLAQGCEVRACNTQREDGAQA